MQNVTAEGIKKIKLKQKFKEKNYKYYSNIINKLNKNNIKRNTLNFSKMLTLKKSNMKKFNIFVCIGV